MQTRAIAEALSARLSIVPSPEDSNSHRFTNIRLLHGQLQPWAAARATADARALAATARSYGIRPPWRRGASHSAPAAAIDDDDDREHRPAPAGFSSSTGAAEALADDDGSKVSWKPCPPLTPGIFFGAVGELCKVRLSGEPAAAP